MGTPLAHNISLHSKSKEAAGEGAELAGAAELADAEGWAWGALGKARAGGARAGGGGQALAPLRTPDGPQDAWTRRGRAGVV